MMRKLVLWSVILTVVVLLSRWGWASETNSCPVCHTNGNILKSLYRPPDMKNAEGEG